jgi:anti-sigma regulatory factor (Ser/Thr protein kinase)
MTGASRAGTTAVAPAAGTPVTVPPMSPGSVRVPHERAGVRLARHAFAAEMDAAGICTEDRDDAMLVLSELVSNAVRHAAPLPTGEVAVCWSVRPDALQLEITDGGASTRPQAAAAALSSFGGRGLDIVRTVSRQWGVTEGEETVTVWAEVARTTGGAASGGPAPAG